MKINRNLTAILILLSPVCVAANEPLVLPETSASINADSTTVASEKPESESRADKRYDEMLGKMRAAVEEIAQLYGNPVFLQVFTNDAGKAAELKERLKAAQGTEEIRRELENLEKKRNDLMSDIALKERETAKLTAKLTRQRAALDMVAAAVDQARQAVEDTAK
jgi:hypothetical protein